MEQIGAKRLSNIEVGAEEDNDAILLMFSDGAVILAGCTRDGLEMYHSRYLCVTHRL